MWAVFQVFVAFCADTQYVLSSERGSHIECALEICPALDASLACIPDEEVNAVIAELKVFVSLAPLEGRRRRRAAFYVMYQHLVYWSGQA